MKNHGFSNISLALWRHDSGKGVTNRQASPGLKEKENTHSSQSRREISLKEARLSWLFRCIEGAVSSCRALKKTAAKLTPEIKRDILFAGLSGRGWSFALRDERLSFIVTMSCFLYRSKYKHFSLDWNVGTNRCVESKKGFTMKYIRWGSRDWLVVLEKSYTMSS